MKSEDLFQQIADAIAAQMEAGVLPWHKPWSETQGAARNAVSGKAYRGANVFWLEMARQAKGYGSNLWLSFKQAKDLGGSVRKGEQGSAVFFWMFDKKADPVTGELKPVVWAKAYTVFNLDQCDDVKVPAKHAAPLVQPCPDVRNAIAEQLMLDTGAVIRHGGDVACYVPSLDIVKLPAFAQFESADAYYSTAFHELGHWTGHKSRLNREYGKRFGDEAYAFEELVAELTAAFVCLTNGFDNPARDDHAAYIKHWLKVLKSDKRAFITAAGAAQKAADLILGTAKAQEQAPDAQGESEGVLMAQAA